MIVIDESNMVHCPHCTAELSAYDFEDFTNDALSDGMVCEGHSICLKCNGRVYIEVSTYVTADIVVKKL